MSLHYGTVIASEYPSWILGGYLDIGDATLFVGAPATETYGYWYGYWGRYPFRGRPGDRNLR